MKRGREGAGEGGGGYGYGFRVFERKKSKERNFVMREYHEVKEIYELCVCFSLNIFYNKPSAVKLFIPSAAIARN